jgi:hypothetical protein
MLSYMMAGATDRHSTPGEHFGKWKEPYAQNVEIWQPGSSLSGSLANHRTFEKLFDMTIELA